MIISIKKNGQDIAANQTLQTGVAYVGAFDATANGKKFAIVQSMNVPTIGSTSYAYDPADISGGAATITPTTNQGNGKAYFVVGTINNSQVTIEEVFPVTQNLMGGD